MGIKCNYICAVLLMLCISMPALAQDAQADKLIGWWLFDSVKDETGNWGDIALHGAKIKDGQLIVETGKWAHALEYSGPDIEEKTLMTWVALDSLAQRRGSALSLDKASEDQFDAIVYAHRQPNQWMSDSSWYHRTEDFPKAHNENKEDEMVYLAFTYEDKGGTYKITGYRNGENLGSYEKGGIKTWPTGDAEAIWGKRYTNGLGGPGDLNAHIEESRIYAVALTEAEINEMQIGTISVHPDVSRLSPRPEDINEDGVVNIQDLVLVASNFGKTGENSADVNGDGVVNIADLVLVAGALGNSATAPSLHPDTLEMPTTTSDVDLLPPTNDILESVRLSQNRLVFVDGDNDVARFYDASTRAAITTEDIYLPDGRYWEAFATDNRLIFLDEAFLDFGEINDVARFYNKSTHDALTSEDIILPSGFYQAAFATDDRLIFVDFTANIARFYNKSTRAAITTENITFPWGGYILTAFAIDDRLIFVEGNRQVALFYNKATHTRIIHEGIKLHPGDLQQIGVLFEAAFATDDHYVFLQQHNRTFRARFFSRTQTQTLPEGGPTQFAELGGITLPNGYYQAAFATDDRLIFVDNAADIARFYDVSTRAAITTEDIILPKGNYRVAFSLVPIGAAP